MAAGLIVGGWFASTVITKLITGLVDYVKDQKKMQLGLNDELKRLDKTLPKIQAVVDAVDQGLIKEKNPALEKWLWQLRDAADQADDVMDEMEYNFVKEKVEAGKDKVNKVVSNLTTFLKRAVHNDAFLKKLKAVVKAIDDVTSDVGEFYTLVQELANKQKEKDKSTINSRETSPVLNVGNHVFGREKDKAVVIEKLLNPESKANETNYAVLPIIGAGGVGKTTLAQLVYNDSAVKNNFELRMWVCISNNFDVDMLTKKLYESVVGQRADADYFASIQTKLEEKLKCKKFLIVFDDAWNDSDRRGWEKLMAPLKCGKSGSMILLTTRMETVARLIGPNLMDSVFLEGLNELDMWNLFEECAFGGKDPNDYTELIQMGKDIVKKLDRNPLAARTVGGALCSDLTDIYWKSILESELWSIEQGPNDIMPALRLSYQHLPSHLKPCFSFCSIFPQDHVFIKDDLIYMWLALGLVPRDFNGARKPEDVGLRYFDDLLKRSVFTPVDRFGIRNDAYVSYRDRAIMFEKTFTGVYIMHDLMHDLSTFVSQGECLKYDTSKSVPIPPTVRHLYIHVDAYYQWSNFDLKNIRTLIVDLAYNSNHPEIVSILNRMLKGMRSLRILKLIVPRLSEIPQSVGDLLHLRYLSSNLWITCVFPKSISKLFLLETIVTGELRNHKEAAEVLVKLNNLRHIISSQPFVETIANIGRLTSLQELCFRVGKDSGFKISELGEMKELRHLSISNINDVNTREEAKQANLKNKVDLRELSLQWETKIHETKIFDEVVLDHLEPYRNLKDLIIRGYMGGRLPVWETESLSSLVKLRISNCCNLISLDEGLLRNCENLVALKELTIFNCKELQMPKEGFRRFISLQRLDVCGCPKIKIFDVLVFCPPSKLRFLRINGYMDNGVKRNGYVNDFIGNLNENFICESSLQHDPTLHTEEANKIYVLDHPIESSNFEMRFTRMRDYIGRWPPIWLKKTLSMLEYLCIDGSDHTDQRHSNYGMDQLLELIRLDEIGKVYYPSLQIAYPSNMPAPEQIYLAMQDIKHVQYLKKLTLALCSKSCVMPPLPATLKELRLYCLDMKLLPNNCGDSEANLSKALENVDSLSSLSLIWCKNISSLPSRGVFSRWKTLEKVELRYCQELTSLESLRGLSSVRLLIIGDCPKLVSAITSPSAGKKYETEGMVEDGTIQTSNRPASTQQTPADPSSSTNTEHKLLLSVGELKIGDPLLLYIEPIRSLSSVRKFTIAHRSRMQSLPELPFFVTLRELKLYDLGLVHLPNLCVNHSKDSGSLPSLVSMEIGCCPNLLSLNEGLFQKPEQFAALEKVMIWDCENLRKLPQGGFSKFTSLKELGIGHCPKIEGKLVPECFLPSALRVLNVFNCGDLDANLSKALEGVDSLISLVLKSCSNIRNLPPREVFSRWKTLERLEFDWCLELTSLESLLGLSSVRLLTIRECPKLVSAITSAPAGNKDEIEGIVKGGTIQTSNRPASTHPTPIDPSSSTNTEHKPLLSVGELEIDHPLLLYIEPIRSLSSVRKLTINYCSRIQSLPDLPPISEELSLLWCSPELKRRCEESGEDWPKLSPIPKVSITQMIRL